MNNTPQELVDAICKAAKKYCNSFRDEIGDMLEEDMTVPIDENSSNSEIMKCFEPNVLIIDTPEEPLVVGYQLECSCDWEVEYGMEIDILDDILINLSSFDGGSPWLDWITVDGKEYWLYYVNRDKEYSEIESIVDEVALDLWQQIKKQIMCVIALDAVLIVLLLIVILKEKPCSKKNYI